MYLASENGLSEDELMAAPSMIAAARAVRHQGPVKLCLGEQGNGVGEA